MKRSDILFIGAAVVVLLPFFVSRVVYDAFLAMTANHPFLMAFIKFSLLSTAGECIGQRIRTGEYAPKGFGVVPRGLTWGLLGMLITAAMAIFSNGVPAVLGMLGVVPEHASYGELLRQGILSSRSWFHVLAAFCVSLMMNTLFAPVFMILHKVSDAHIVETGGTLRGYFSPLDFGRLFAGLDWNMMWSFLLKKTIPLFWVPAHTITFLLPPEWRVLFAAMLGVMLGVFMSFAKRK